MTEIKLHEILMNLLSQGDMYTIDGIVSEIESLYHLSYDSSVIDDKINMYLKDNVVIEVIEKDAKYYYIGDDNASKVIEEVDGIEDAILFYTQIKPFERVGRHLINSMNSHNNLFITKETYSYPKSQKVLLEITNAINCERYINIKMDNKDIITLIPLKIYLSAKKHKSYLIGNEINEGQLQSYELKNISEVIITQKVENYSSYIEKLSNREEHIWGVDGIEKNSDEQILKVIMNIEEYYEQPVINRIKREGRNGILKRIGDNIYQYSIKLLDCEEILPWIMTFMGRIVLLECTDKRISRRYYSEINKIHTMYFKE